MRQETKKIAQAFIDGATARAARTHTDGEALYLHGNRIAWFDKSNDLHLTLAGWPGVTTRERLNGICELLYDSRPFHQKRGVQFHNDSKIGDHTIITYHNITPVQLAAE